MAVSYEKLFNLLDKKSIKKTDIMKELGLSSTTNAKLSKNENIS